MRKPIEEKTLTLNKTSVMVSFAEIVKTVDHLSEEEIAQLREILRKKAIEKKEQEILRASEEAMREYEEGKTISVQSPEELKNFFNKLMNEAN